MFVAISAFVLQAALISVSQAQAAVGAIPMPSVTLSGSLHFHDQLAGHVHSHAGDDAEGHVHDGPDHDEDGTPGVAWDMFGTSIASAQVVHLLSVFEVLGAMDLPLARAIVGVRPDGLVRPPSTFSIA
ncbi:hypothetical protein I6F14_31445 [Bradyrhizobium sp. IC3069]|uniref:hypothetical protein n=1 Tax=Bradyrhizobium TaxID=374 RepID=UPI001CD70B65|nr:MULTISPECIES: hypothetical protein [Bradyrhizobium]MCA1364346.1 hypothetical protein [Bradyrhizobium sp. IC4059]MCA1522453.1 hypothetical protein [Bradyrhizobium sp. IC3069]MCA1529152.1 hypothetical protein [Bradyrhizobium yuanmingense]MCA1551827.1 hypothetical protein [Bradyrhizobium sp. BRP19]UWU85930.1 hypothetical protein N2605_05565 [Bradyrhizobium sp. CB1024]